jgi:hypothetical protein
MPISEYILLALLAAGGIAVPDGISTTTLGADAIAQPNGGASTVAHVRKRTDTKKDGGKITAARSKGHGKHKRRVHEEGTTPPAKTTAY